MILSESTAIAGMGMRPCGPRRACSTMWQRAALPCSVFGATSAACRVRSRVLLCRASQKQQKEEKEKRWQPLASPGKQQKASRSSTDLEPEGWRPFDAEAYDRPWSVPWGPGTVAGTMALWVLTFIVTAFAAAPAAYVAVTHTPLWELGPEGQADFALWSEVMELGATALLLWGVTSRHPKESLRDEQLFNYSPSAPFARGRGWLAWGLFGVGMAPLVVGAAAFALSAVGYESVVSGGRGTVDGVAGMLTLDLPTYLRLIMVTGVLAPLLEETLFRGFLLTSFTSFMPTPAAIFASSLAFGVAHLSLKDLPVLVALGCLLGALYVRSRNLLTPMLVHGVWNSTVLTLLFALTASGVDVQQLLKDGTF